jgi:hypothetical protein
MTENLDAESEEPDTSAEVPIPIVTESFSASMPNSTPAQLLL